MKIEIDIPDELYESITTFLENSRDFKDISEMIYKSLQDFIKSNNFLLTTRKGLDV